MYFVLNQAELHLLLTTHTKDIFDCCVEYNNPITYI